MGEKEFREKAIAAVIEYYNEEILRDSTEESKLNDGEIYIVWLTKVLQNNKALISTSRSDGLYFEVTWDGNQNRGYLDAYRKVRNKVIH